MNCGKHCTINDYYHLVNITDGYLKCLDSGHPDALTSKIDLYLETIKDFDYQVAERMRLRIKKADGDSIKIKSIIQAEYNELIRNVLVDVREHN